MQIQRAVLKLLYDREREREREREIKKDIVNNENRLTQHIMSHIVLVYI
jgi:hypothetical protein